MVKLTLIKLIGAAAFIYAGVYHLRYAKQLSDISVQNILRAPPWVQLFFPVRYYGSSFYVWGLRASGAIMLLVGLALFVLVFQHSSSPH